MLPSVLHLVDLKNPRGNPHSTSQGPCPGMPAQSKPYIPAQMICVGSIPEGNEGSGSEGGRGQEPMSPLGHQGSTGLVAMPARPLHLPLCHPVATATLSGLRRSILQHRAWTGGLGSSTACCPLPARPLALSKSSVGVPTQPPRHGINSPPPASAFLTGEGRCPCSDKHCPEPHSTQDRGWFCTQKDLGAREVMKCWGEKTGWSHCYALPAHKGGIEGQCHTKRHASASFLR